ncbi:hypothetical protein DTW90_18540 [Neorhizobium sp. P12A]|uniref:hypothetical protein n=1 Tax=Neorhizobium sp. P12A TaxID=2268027 RepID=UPI0011ECD740|nr:hypothetical protein [Neorhizobium sp. P12A]KAA0697429.1 hypothetical protein DTW90_18540 [Neorhizobium sp. P12A]
MKINILDDNWPWHQNPNPTSGAYRDGWAIVVHDSRTGGQKAYADMVFPTMDGANMTAARIAPGASDILPAREIWHRTKFKRSFRTHRTVIIREAAVA